MEQLYNHLPLKYVVRLNIWRHYLLYPLPWYNHQQHRLFHHKGGDSFYYVDFKQIQYGYRSHSRMEQGKFLAVLVICYLDCKIQTSFPSLFVKFIRKISWK